MNNLKQLTNYQSILSLIIIMASIATFSSCKKMNESYVNYVKDGEIVYVSKADSVKVITGKNRMLVTWEKGTDPKVVSGKIFNYEDQLLKEFPIINLSDSKIQEVLLEDMPEGTYSMKIFTYDNNGNSSVKVNFSGTTYGENYESTLQNRRLKSSTYIANSLNIEWYGSPTDAIGNEIQYESSNGSVKTVSIESDESLSTILDFKPNSPIKYRTKFLPEGNSIDTFYTEFKPLEIEYLLDKSKFKRWNTADFPYTQYGAAYNIEKLWDEVYTGYGYIYLETLPLPRSFTFDLGVTADIDKIKLSPNWDSQLYQNGNVKVAEIWGSNSENVTSDFESWTLLGTFQSIKPSGLPLGQSTAEDLAYAKQGEYFDLNNNLTPVRYLRFVVKDTWSGSISMHITELTFWGTEINN